MTRHKTAIHLVYMCCVSICRDGSFLSANAMVQRAEFVDAMTTEAIRVIVSIFSIEMGALQATCTGGGTSCD